jgi:hypothetical protein
MTPASYALNCDELLLNCIALLCYHLAECFNEL